MSALPKISVTIQASRHDIVCAIAELLEHGEEPTKTAIKGCLTAQFRLFGSETGWTVLDEYPELRARATEIANRLYPPALQESEGKA